MKKKRTNFKFYFFVEFSTIYFVLCFYFKHLVLGLNSLNFETENLWFKFVYLKNTGAAFSLLSEMNMFLAVFSLLVALSLCGYVFKNIRTLNIVELHGFSFLLGGILSNTFERFTDGFVTDYIQLKFVNFPVFNLADVFINIGVLLILLAFLFGRKVSTRR